MKSGVSCVICMVLMTSFFVLSSVVSVAEGKCAGKWAIHACWGGNGKRSGIPARDEASETISLLRKWLLRRPSPAYIPTPDDDGDTDVLDAMQSGGLLSSSANSLLPPPSSSSSSSSSSALSSGFEERFPSGDVGRAPFASSGGDRLMSLKRILRTLQQAEDENDFQ